MARLGHRTDEDHRSADQSHRTRWKCIRCFPPGDPVNTGYGYSGKPTTTGWDCPHIARAWVVLMKRLGYTKFVAQGGDWGAVITEQMFCLRLRSCSAFTPTCLACFRTTLTTRLFPGRRRHRVSQPRRNSLTSVCSSYIKRVSDTVTRWDCARRHCTESWIRRWPGGLFP